MNFGLVETLLGTPGHESVHKYIERTGKHLALLSAVPHAIRFSSVAINPQLTTAHNRNSVGQHRGGVAQGESNSPKSGDVWKAQGSAKL